MKKPQIIVAPKNKIYVGNFTNHKCAKKMIKKAQGQFACNTNCQKIFLPIKICESCGALIISQKAYIVNRDLLKGYIFRNGQSGQPILNVSRSEKYIPNYNDKEKKTNASSAVIWALKHPFQGGGCNGK